MLTEEQQEKLSDDTASLRIKAKDAQLNTVYLVHGLWKKVFIEKVSATDNVTAVFPDESDSNYKRLVITGGTELIPFDENIYNMTKTGKKKKESAAPKLVKMFNDALSSKKEKGPKMSDIINPMIFDGKSPEEIADAVIAAIPSKAGERNTLIQQIKGPRTWNLKKAHPEKFAK
jgi:hypothetical protein